MKKYKGHYIDHVIFNSKEEIDTHIKNELIYYLKLWNELFISGKNFTDTDYTDGEYKMAVSIEMSKIEQRLHDEYNMEWDEIEELPYVS